MARSNLNRRTISKNRLSRLLILASCTAFLTFEGVSQDGRIPAAFMQLDQHPRIIRCTNELEINDQGGHLQGVQLLKGDGADYAVMTGSSSASAYYGVAETWSKQEVISITTLMLPPFKHAGGFQIFENLMAVGIEDDAAKDQSRVSVYEISDPEKPPLEALTTIERRGEPFRSTAGCTGIARVGKKILLVVGDWDTKHLDFYVSDQERLSQRQNGFQKVFELDMEQIDRSNWVDRSWHSYQNINLLTGSDGQLFLFGFERPEPNRNVADLFQIHHKNLTEFSLQKISSRVFDCQEGASFRAGAGIYQEADGSLKIVACGSHISSTLVLNVFE